MTGGLSATVEDGFLLSVSRYAPHSNPANGPH